MTHLTHGESNSSETNHALTTAPSCSRFCGAVWTDFLVSNALEPLVSNSIRRRGMANRHESQVEIQPSSRHLWLSRRKIPSHFSRPSPASAHLFHAPGGVHHGHVQGRRRSRKLRLVAVVVLMQCSRTSEKSWTYAAVCRLPKSRPKLHPHCQ